MNRPLISLSLCAMLWGSTAMATPFEDIIAEDAELFFTVRSFAEIQKKLSAHPMAEFLEIDFMEDWIGGDSQKNENGKPSSDFAKNLEETFMLNVNEFFELFSGQASLAVYNLSDLIIQKDKRPEAVLMAEYSGETEQLMELMQIQFERNAEKQKEANPLIEHEIIEESFMGETLYFDEVFDGETTYIEDGYALVDDILVIATPENHLREAVELIKSDTRQAISKLDTYQRYSENTDTSDITVYLNLVKLMPPLNTALFELPMIQNLAAFGVTPQSLESALSLESLQALYINAKLVEDGFLFQYGMLFDEKQGLLSLMDYANSTLPEAPYVPEDALSASISLFDLNGMLANLEKMLALTSPALPPLIDMQMQMAQANVGVDVRASILENFGDQIVNFSVVSKDTPGGSEQLQPNQILVIDLNDAQAFRDAVNALKDISPAKSSIEEQLYEGETIYSVTQPSAQGAPEMQFNYAITRSKLIINIGHVSLLHETLSSMANDNKGFWQNPQTQSLFERIERPNAVARTFLNVEQFAGPFFKMLAENNSGNLPASVQSGEVPNEFKGPYRLISEVNEEPGSIFGRTLAIEIRENQ